MGSRQWHLAFLDRPLEGDWPYLRIDATYVKVRQSGRIVSVATIIAVAVNGEGRRQVLGMATGPSEAEPFWTAFLRSLMRRSLRGPLDLPSENTRAGGPIPSPGTASAGSDRHG